MRVSNQLDFQEHSLYWYARLLDGCSKWLVNKKKAAYKPRIGLHSSQWHVLCPEHALQWQTWALALVRDDLCSFRCWSSNPTICPPYVAGWSCQPTWYAIPIFNLWGTLLWIVYHPGGAWCGKGKFPSSSNSYVNPIESSIPMLKSLPLQSMLWALGMPSTVAER